MDAESGLTRFGNYLLVDRIAAGGMAEVFNARVVGIRGFSKTVALKRIHAHLLERKRFLRMFTDEAKIASQLNHPNIVNILELDEAEGIPFIAMEYVFGRDLKRVFERLSEECEPFPWPMAVRIALDLAQGLHHAHEYQSAEGHAQNIVHRDVCPRNVLLAADGAVKLTDFGVARARDREEETEHGFIRGRILYMSPETASGEAVDRRSDVFSLGVVFSELLTMTPFRSGKSDVAILNAIRDGSAHLHRFDALPDELRAVLNRALARRPEDRYPTAEAFRTDLANLATGPIAPMTRVELGRFVSLLFAEEFAAERRRQLEIDTMLKTWPRTGAAPTRTEATPSRKDSKAQAKTRGDLSATSLARVLASLHRNARTGRLDLSRAPVNKSIYYVGGEPVFVLSNVTSEMFGEYLVNRSILSREDLERALERSEAQGLRLIDVLLRTRTIPPSELYRSLAEQVRDRILDLFSWSEGVFAYFPDEQPPEAGMPLNLQTLKIIHEGVMDQLPMTAVRRAVGPGSGIVRRTYHPIPKGLPLSGREQRLLGRIQAKALSVAELAKDEGGRERAHRLIYLLLELDLITIEDS